GQTLPRRLVGGRAALPKPRTSPLGPACPLYFYPAVDIGDPHLTPSGQRVAFRPFIARPARERSKAETTGQRQAQRSGQDRRQPPDAPQATDVHVCLPKGTYGSGAADAHYSITELQSCN